MCRDKKLNKGETTTLKEKKEDVEEAAERANNCNVGRIGMKKSQLWQPLRKTRNTTQQLELHWTYFEENLRWQDEHV